MGDGECLAELGAAHCLCRFSFTCRKRASMGGFIPLPVENSFTYGIQPENCNVEPARSRRTKILQVKEKRHPFSVAG